MTGLRKRGVEKNHLTNPLLVRCPCDYYWQHWKSRQSLSHLGDSPWTTKICQKKSSCWVLANPFPISHTHLHMSSCMWWALAQQQGLLIQPQSTTAAAHVQVQVFLPSLWKRVLSLVPEISLFPPYLKIPPRALNKLLWHPSSTDLPLPNFSHPPKAFPPCTEAIPN